MRAMVISGAHERPLRVGELVSHMKALSVITAMFAFLGCVQGAESPGWEGLIAHKGSELYEKDSSTMRI